MEGDTIIGCIIIACALCLMTYLTFWSRRTINWISTKGQRSAREIVKELDSGRQ